MFEEVNWKDLKVKKVRTLTEKSRFPGKNVDLLGVLSLDNNHITFSLREKFI